MTTASVKENCNIAKVLYLKTCEDVTGYKNNTKQEWISEKTQDEITLQEEIKGRISVSKQENRKLHYKQNTWMLIKLKKVCVKGLQKMGTWCYEESRRCCTK